MVPAKQSETFLAILERACALIAQAEAKGNPGLLKRSERLLLLLPKLVLTAPVLSPQASQSMPLGYWLLNQLRTGYGGSIPARGLN